MRTFQQFTEQVAALLDGTAAGKGYSKTGVDGPNQLYEFVQTMVEGHDHALGEIVYKAKRFSAKGNEEDILKIAAWAWLIWKHNASAVTPPSPSTATPPTTKRKRRRS